MEIVGIEYGVDFICCLRLGILCQSCCLLVVVWCLGVVELVVLFQEVLLGLQIFCLLRVIRLFFIRCLRIWWMFIRDSGVLVLERCWCRVWIGIWFCFFEVFQSVLIIFSWVRFIFRLVFFNICLMGEWVIVMFFLWMSGQWVFVEVEYFCLLFVCVFWNWVVVGCFYG